MDQMKTLKSPLGRLEIRGEKNEIVRCRRQLAEYFRGTRRVFRLPLHLSGTDFQKKVWRRLMYVPYGKTISYAELANRIGQPKAYRAVANACGQNPLPILIPCHRVIASDGKLGGYSSGLKRKRWLLWHEKNICRNTPLTVARG